MLTPAQPKDAPSWVQPIAPKPRSCIDGVGRKRWQIGLLVLVLVLLWCAPRPRAVRVSAVC
jgi:hypothetical protein